MAAGPSAMSICNLALAFLGGEQLASVEAPWDESALGVLCLNHFSQVLDLALEAHDWSFARARSILAEKPEARPQRGYRHRYALPSDCLRPVRLGSERPFILEGQDLLTEAAPAELHYISRVDDARAFPPAFKTALAWGLASVLTTARSNDPRKMQFCQQQYNLFLAEAMARDNNTRGEAPGSVTGWLESRTGWTGRAGI